MQGQTHMLNATNQLVLVVLRYWFSPMIRTPHCSQNEILTRGGSVPVALMTLFFCWVVIRINQTSPPHCFHPV